MDPCTVAHNNCSTSCILTPRPTGLTQLTKIALCACKPSRTKHEHESFKTTRLEVLTEVIRTWALSSSKISRLKHVHTHGRHLCQLDNKWSISIPQDLVLLLPFTLQSSLCLPVWPWGDETIITDSWHSPSWWARGQSQNMLLRKFFSFHGIARNTFQNMPPHMKDLQSLQNASFHKSRLA